MTITINGTTGIAGVDGSAATPSVQGNDTNTGMFFPAADTVGIATGGTEVMRIDSSGNVGIKTTSPTGNLTIGGVAPRLDFLESDGSAGFNNTILIRSADVFAIQTRNGSTFVSNDYRMTANASGALTHEFKTADIERMRIDSSGNLLFNSGYGSAATAYGCRAWVNFNGTGVVAIRASGNVTSITDNGNGDYTINLTTAMPDVNYSCVCSGSQADFASVNHAFSIYDVFAPTTSSVRLINQSSNGGNADLSYANVAIFR